MSFHIKKPPFLAQVACVLFVEGNRAVRYTKRAPPDIESLGSVQRHQRNSVGGIDLRAAARNIAPSLPSEGFCRNAGILS